MEKSSRLDCLDQKTRLSSDDHVVPPGTGSNPLDGHTNLALDILDILSGLDGETLKSLDAGGLGAPAREGLVLDLNLVHGVEVGGEAGE